MTRAADILPPDVTVVACPVCGQVHAAGPVPPGCVAECVRCGSRLERRTHGSLHRTAAFAIAAVLLYVPAYALPLLKLNLYGAVAEDTVWAGIVGFYRANEVTMAVIVFLASLLIPAMKLVGLLFLVATTGLRWQGGRRLRTNVHRVIELIGRYAMLDIFALSIWVALVRVKPLATVTPGPGLLPFGGLVVFTLLASQSFDPRLIWEDEAIPA